MLKMIIQKYSSFSTQYLLQKIKEFHSQIHFKDKT